MAGDGMFGRQRVGIGETCPSSRDERAGVRAPIVAGKPGNSGGAKGAQEGGSVMNGSKETKRAEVPLLLFAEQQTAQQAREIRSRWDWAEPEVWTVRMLRTLEEGVKGGKWFRLVDKVYNPSNLRKAFARVKANGGGAGVDHVTVEMFARDLDANLEKLARSLKDGTYRPQEIKRHWIPKPGSNEKRPLGIPTVRDRVVQTAMRSVLEPIFEREFAEHSYGFRPKRGCKDALRRVADLSSKGYTWVVDADLKSYFDTIPHEPLMKLVEERVADGKVLSLIRAFLKQGVLEGLKRWTPEEGSPQGAVISPLLSNIYLNPLDQMMAREGFEMVRYADDFVILCRSREEADAALERVRQWTAQAGLKLHPEKTRIVHIERDDSGPGDGFDFLGYRFKEQWKLVRDKSLKKIKETIREKTPRRNGKSLQEIIHNLNRTLRGWFEYFKDSVRNQHDDLDGFIRRRLRSMLMRRRKKKGNGRGNAQTLFPNSFFAKMGLYSLEAAHIAARNPVSGKTANWRAGCGKTARPVRREGGR